MSNHKGNRAFRRDTGSTLIVAKPTIPLASRWRRRRVAWGGGDALVAGLPIVNHLVQPEDATWASRLPGGDGASPLRSRPMAESLAKEDAQVERLSR